MINETILGDSPIVVQVNPFSQKLSQQIRLKTRKLHDKVRSNHRITTETKMAKKTMKGEERNPIEKYRIIHLSNTHIHSFTLIFKESHFPIITYMKGQKFTKIILFSHISHLK